LLDSSMSDSSATGGNRKSPLGDLGAGSPFVEPLPDIYKVHCWVVFIIKTEVGVQYLEPYSVLIMLLPLFRPSTLLPFPPFLPFPPSIFRIFGNPSGP